MSVISNPGFWVVWCPESGNPRVRHQSREGAESKAKSLAASHRGRAFYVLRAEGFAQVEDVTYTELDDIPF